MGEVEVSRRLRRGTDIENPMEGLSYTASDLIQECNAISLDGVQNDKVYFGFESFSQKFEGDITQSDYALIIKFKDTSNNATAQNNREWIYLIQAKIARPYRFGEGINPDWDSDAYFEDTNGQSEKIANLKRFMGKLILYNLYCPDRVADLIGAQSSIDEAARLYPDLCGEKIARDSSMWLRTELDKNIGDIFSADGEEKISFVQFIMNHLFSPSPAWIEPEDTQHELLPLRARRSLLQKVLGRDTDAMNELRSYAIPGKGPIPDTWFQNILPVRWIELEVRFPRLEYDLAQRRRPDTPDTSPSSPSR
ncbi:hypothetical protein [Asaia sp. SF2.1]|uniref:hypothetical protein n=1 Tax=Asaia sp. SF2.1 TaxID=406101 RepID=UPI0003D374D1|nr:hypothetical protein [Asaia sp. SF2.1]ETC99539.1 hypothetical protein P792_03655 [Asaia sp. SF2.1]